MSQLENDQTTIAHGIPPHQPVQVHLHPGGNTPERPSGHPGGLPPKWVAAVAVAAVFFGLIIGFLLGKKGSKQVEFELCGQKIVVESGQEDTIKGLETGITQLTAEQTRLQSLAKTLQDRIDAHCIAIEDVPLRMKAENPRATLMKLDSASRQLDSSDADVEWIAHQLNEYFKDHSLNTRSPLGANATIDLVYRQLARVLFEIGDIKDFAAFTNSDLGDAVRAIQKKHGLEPDGKVGKKTWPKIFEDYELARSS